MCVSACVPSPAQKVMTKIGAVCLITIGVWVVIELAVMFGHYNHECGSGVGECNTAQRMADTAHVSVSPSMGASVTRQHAVQALLLSSSTVSKGSGSLGQGLSARKQCWVS